MNSFILQFCSDGDICILESDLFNDYEVIYHKTYNPSESLELNLYNAIFEFKKVVCNCIKE